LINGDDVSFFAVNEPKNLLDFVLGESVQPGLQYALHPLFWHNHVVVFFVIEVLP
jgi:hypothetical protein